MTMWYHGCTPEYLNLFKTSRYKRVSQPVWLLTISTLSKKFISTMSRPREKGKDRIETKSRDKRPKRRSKRD